MKNWIIVTILIGSAISAIADTYRADVIADAYTYYRWSGWPYPSHDGSYGLATSLYIYNYKNGDSVEYAYAYLKFDLGGLPEGATIDSVTFHVKGWSDTVLPANINYVGDDSWNETNLDYYSQPSNQVGVADTSSWIIDSNTLWMARSLAVSNWNPAADIEDDELSLRLISDGPRGYYTARENGTNTAAYLEINYTPPPTLEVCRQLDHLFPPLAPTVYCLEPW